ncbi:hypothetical protein ACHAXS_011725 [Conticribra weissflogii]
MTLVHEEAEERFQAIRRDLNNLALDKIDPKEKKIPFGNAGKRRIGTCDSAMLPFDGIRGKAGKSSFPIMVGEVSNLYKTGKRKSSFATKRYLSIDLHGHTSAEALAALNDALPRWIEEAMKGSYPWVIPVNVISGCGNQVLSEVVEKWIGDNEHVANRPK